MLMVLVDIMVSRPMLLLVGGVADADKRLVESMLLEQLRSGATGCSRSAAVLTVADLRKTMEDPAI